MTGETALMYVRRLNRCNTSLCGHVELAMQVRQSG
jgi:hypothetical protein